MFATRALTCLALFASAAGTELCSHNACQSDDQTSLIQVKTGVATGSERESGDPKTIPGTHQCSAAVLADCYKCGRGDQDRRELQTYAPPSRSKFTIKPVGTFTCKTGQSVCESDHEILSCFTRDRKATWALESFKWYGCCKGTTFEHYESGSDGFTPNTFHYQAVDAPTAPAAATASAITSCKINGEEKNPADLKKSGECAKGVVCSGISHRGPECEGKQDTCVTKLCKGR